MRLTLRILLAYMDNILGPEDAQLIGKKVEESEFAAGLLHRIRDVMRRLRLGAPGASGGPGLDPNTVAEYLDNTLPADRVPECEKICLESDVHLAEVAACHQILTLVLGEPAEVDPASRQRMYELPRQAAVQAAGTAAGIAAGGGNALPAIDQPDQHPRPKTGVPEYLREPAHAGHRSWRAAAAAAALVLVLLALVWAFNPLGAGTRLAKLLGDPRPSGKYGSVDEPTGAFCASAALPTAAGPSSGQPSTSPAPAEPAKESRLPLATSPEPPGGARSVAAAGVATSPAPGEQPKSGSAAGPTPPGDKVPPPPLPGNGEAAPRAGIPATGPISLPGTVKPEGMVPPVPGRPAGDEKPALPLGPPAVASAPPPEPQAPPAAERLGRFVSDHKQVLLQYDGASGTWLRVPPQSLLSASVPLLALPTYQPTIALSSGAIINLLGSTQVELLPSDPQGVTGLSIPFGRVILRNVGEAKIKLRLQLGRRSGMVTLPNAESTAAVDVYRQRDPGVNPETKPGRLLCDLYAVKGQFMWEEPDRAAVGVSTPGWLALKADQPAPPPWPIRSLPPWVVGEEGAPLDRRAGPILESAIALDRPVALSLHEMIEHRQREVAWLATRCLGYVGQFEPMVAVLNAPEQKMVWDEYVAQLQMALSRGPDVALQVRQALEKRYPQEAAELYRMLWGYNEKDIQDGLGADLVRHLDDDLLAAKVLSFYNLRKLTGAKYAYYPLDPPVKRQAAIQRWQERVKSGLLGAHATETVKPEEPVVAAPPGGSEQPPPVPPPPAPE